MRNQNPQTDNGKTGESVVGATGLASAKHDPRLHYCDDPDCQGSLLQPSEFPHRCPCSSTRPELPLFELDAQTFQRVRRALTVCAKVLLSGSDAHPAAVAACAAACIELRAELEALAVAQ